MREILLSIVLIVIVSIGSSFVLESLERSAENVYQVPANVRLN